MKNFFQKQRELIAVLVYILIIVGIVYLVIFPLMRKIDAMNNQIQEGEMKQEIVRQHISELPKTKKQFETLQEGGDLSGVLLDKDKAVILIEKLEKMAEQNGVTIVIDIKGVDDSKKVSVKSTAATTEGAIITGLPSQNYLQFKITLNGKYESIVNFVRTLEGFEYYNDIIGIQINNNDSNYSEQKMQVNSSVIGASPFASNAKGSNAVIAKNSNESLIAVLNTVFYVK